MNNTQRLASIDRLLSGIPTFQCKAGCSDCCGPIVMSRLELKRLSAASGIPAKELTTEFRLKSGCLDCPLVDPVTNKCTQYEIRPAICKIFGSSEIPRLACPHGLGPAVKLTKEQTNSLMDQVMNLGHGCSERLEVSAHRFLDFMGETVPGTYWKRETPGNPTPGA